MRSSTELTINLGHLAYNYDLLKKRTPNNQTIFMIKANAYGHGTLELVQFAYDELGITEFGCASLGEAIFIRKSLSHLKCLLYVFSDGELDREIYRQQYVDYNIYPVISSYEDLVSVVKDSNLKWLPLVLKFDTGMNRLGLRVDEVDKIVEILKKHKRANIHHLATHFANSYVILKDGDRTKRQYDKFLKVKSDFEQAGIEVIHSSCANSGAIEQSFGLDHSHIRPGLMMYGPASTGKKDLWAGRTISTLKTKVLKVSPIKKGTPVGYGGHVCGKDGHVVYLPIGYGDGFLTYFSGAVINIQGQKAKVLGRVNMDLTAFYFDALPKELKVGSEVILWDSEEYDVSELSTQLKTIPYQLFTGITARVPRRYIK